MRDPVISFTSPIQGIKYYNIRVYSVNIINWAINFPCAILRSRSSTGSPMRWPLDILHLLASDRGRNQRKSGTKSHVIAVKKTPKNQMIIRDWLWPRRCFPYEKLTLNLNIDSKICADFHYLYIVGHFAEFSAGQQGVITSISLCARLVWLSFIA